uniref:Hypothetical_protein n=1 Tax=Oryza glaberrima TaxID=4538 RepID=G2XMT7_ORYGL|nr:hypothetical_protein [Oryza glaberrima]
MAGELLNCLAAIGVIMDFPPAILGMTVLAWGNSVGDLVADVALAKSGQPTIAIAGCFAGPMFNMLVGLGTALLLQSNGSFRWGWFTRCKMPPGCNTTSYLGS